MAAFTAHPQLHNQLYLPNGEGNIVCELDKEDTLQKLSPQSRHKLWVNAQVSMCIHHPPVLFFDEDNERKVYVYSRNDDGKGEVLSMCPHKGAEHHENIEVDTLTEGMKVDENNSISRQAFEELRDPDSEEPVSAWRHQSLLQHPFFLDMLDKNPLDLSAIHGSKNAASAAYEHLKMVAKWGKGLKFFHGDCILLKQGDSQDTWEVMWEDGPMEWASFVSHGAPVPWEHGSDAPIHILDASGGQDWIAEPNLSFSLSFSSIQSVA